MLAASRRSTCVSSERTMVVMVTVNGSMDSSKVKIHQRGVQWKQGVVIYMMLATSLLYSTTPIHCTPLPLHPPVVNTHKWRSLDSFRRSRVPPARRWRTLSRIPCRRTDV